MLEKLKKWYKKNEAEIDAITTIVTPVFGDPASALRNAVNLAQRFPNSKGGYTIMYDMVYGFGPCPYCGHVTYSVKEDPYIVWCPNHKTFLNVNIPGWEKR